ncbi:MAG: hypothetical protein LC808_43840, partial [Actinobacteria bacterium]|nr:hypothetical protein [Actinomycetota bacterium]
PRAGGGACWGSGGGGTASALGGAWVAAGVATGEGAAVWAVVVTLSPTSTTANAATASSVTTGPRLLLFALELRRGESTREISATNPSDINHTR